MRSSKLVTEIVIWCIIYLIALSSAVGAVNSVSCAGARGEAAHSLNSYGAKETIDELNDYFEHHGQKHLAYKHGRVAAEHIMLNQEYQPQHYFVMTHGEPADKIANTGEMVWVGKDWLGDQEMWATDWTNNTHIGGLNWGRIGYPAMPGAFVYLSPCNGFDDKIDPDYLELFQKKLMAWVAVGHTGSPYTSACNKFATVYADRVTDGKKTYWTAIDIAEGKMDNRYRLDNDWYPASKFKVVDQYQKGSGLDHTSADDRYRHIRRKEANEGQALIKNGPPKILTYNLDNYKWKNKNNGGYFVFHGVIDGVKTDPSTGTIVITRKVTRNGQTTTLCTTTYNVANRMTTLHGATVPGGSDICSAYVNAYQCGLGGTLTIEVDFNSNDPNCNGILIDRFEWMEFGK